MKTWARAGQPRGQGNGFNTILGPSRRSRWSNIAWYQGQKRKARFQLRISQDGTTWQDLDTGESSGTSTGFERVFTGPAPARYLQIVCNGNSLNQWNSITEVRLSGVRP